MDHLRYESVGFKLQEWVLGAIEDVTTPPLLQ